ncbi:hypothetical protein HK100_010126, partial [Physocladia obscura]
MQIESILVLTATFVAIGVVWVFTSSGTSKKIDEFPDLPGLPIIGNILDILGPNLKYKVHAAKSPAFLNIPGLPRTLLFDDIALIRQVLGRSLPSYSVVGDSLIGLPAGILSANGVEHRRLRNLGIRALSKMLVEAES